MSPQSSPNSTEIQAIFDQIAPQYDRLNQELSLGWHQIWKLMTVKWCQPQKGDIALDICCGSGDLTNLLSKQVGKTGQVIGLDFSSQQLAIARQRFIASNINWLQGDALNLPFPDCTFDCATIGYGLRNVVDIPRCLGELQRVLKPGAKAAILDFHQPSQAIAKLFQNWYLDHIVVPTADRYGLTDQYAYISPSIDRFPQGREQVKLGYQAGFSDAVHYPLLAGLMGVLVLKK
jgi:demethylmenaquinone methyltransferase/2-methoxy-6-polyprenyl-1,4-benzoquinol methylase